MALPSSSHWLRTGTMEALGCPDRETRMGRVSGGFEGEALGLRVLVE